jgi:capsule polysaccharide export protein KpsE/RkpR
MVFESHDIKRRLIEQFNFYRLFKIANKRGKFEMAIKQLKDYIKFESKEIGSMGLDKTIGYSITCYHPSADTANMICKYAFALLDSTMRNLSVSRAHGNRLFVEDQLQLHKQELDSIQKTFQTFQVENKAFVVPEQIKLSLKNYAEIKSAAILNELKIKSLQGEFQNGLPALDELEKNESVYNQKLSQIESGESPDVVPSLGMSARLLPLYTNLMREMEVQEQVILLLSRELETARIEESKNVSPLVVIDHPYVADYKARPKRLLMLLEFLLVEHFFLLLLFGYQFYYSTVFLKKEGVRSFFQKIKSAS